MGEYLTAEERRRWREAGPQPTPGSDPPPPDPRAGFPLQPSMARAAQRLLALEAQPWLQQAEREAMRPVKETAPDYLRASAAGFYGSAPGLVGRLALEPILERVDPEGLERFREYTAYEPKGFGEELAAGVTALGVEAPTLFAGAGRLATGILGKAVGKEALAGTLARGGGKALAARTAVSSGMFGIADAARTSLRQIAEGRIDPAELGFEFGRGAALGTTLGPLSGLRGPVRIPAEAATLATAGAALEGRLPKAEEIASNLVLFSLLHATTGSARAAHQGLKGARDVATAFRETYRARREGAAEVERVHDAIAAADPAVIDALSRSVNEREAQDLAAKAFGYLPKEIEEALTRTRQGVREARAEGNPEHIERTEREMAVVAQEAARETDLFVRTWNDAVGRVRAERGAAPAAVPGMPARRPISEPVTPERRMALEQEARDLRDEAARGEYTPEQGQEIQRRLSLVGEEIAGMPAEPRIPVEGERQLRAALTGVEAGARPALKMAREVAGAPRPEPAPGAQELRPNRIRRELQRRGYTPEEIRGMTVGEAVEAMRVGRGAPLTYDDMPEFVPREARQDLRRVLAQHGIGSQARKRLMAGPEGWKRAAWAYYQASGKLPQGVPVEQEPRFVPPARPPGPPTAAPPPTRTPEPMRGAVRAAAPAMPAPVFRGWQERARGKPPLDLWDLPEGFAPEIATRKAVSGDTLRAAGMEVPVPPERAPTAAIAPPPAPEGAERPREKARPERPEPTAAIAPEEVVGERLVIRNLAGVVVKTIPIEAAKEAKPKRTLVSDEQYAKDLAFLKETLSGKKLVSVPGPVVDPQVLAALIRVGVYHLETLARGGAKVARDVWKAATRRTIEGAGAEVSDAYLDWLWANPDIKRHAEALVKEVPVEHPPGRGGEAPAERPHVAPGAPRRPLEGPGGRTGPEVPAGPRRVQPVGAPRAEPGGARPHPGRGGPDRPRAPGDRGDRGVQAGVRGLEAPAGAIPTDRDYRYAQGFALAATPKERERLNDEARRILAKNPRDITPADRDALAKYSGFGGLGIKGEHGGLFEHYTSVPIARFVWDKLRAIGWRGKDVLEPAAGSGVFLGTKAQGVSVTGVELDATAAHVARVLYPEQRILNKPFEFVGEDIGPFDLVIGNPPFEEARGALRYSPEAREYRDVGTLHDFFVVKGIDRLRGGGVLAYIISPGFMDKIDPAARLRIAEKADLVAAYRLPSGVFAENTQYQGAVDLVLFRRRARAESPGSTTWTGSEAKGEGGPLNNYWRAHPEKVLGELIPGYKVKYARQWGVKGTFTDKAMVEVLNDEIRLAAPKKEPPVKVAIPVEEGPTGIENPPGVQLGQHFIQKGEIYVAAPRGGESYRGKAAKEKVRSAVQIMDALDRVRDLMVAGKPIETVKLAQVALRALIDKHLKSYRNEKDGRLLPPGRDNTLMRSIEDDPRVYALGELVSDSGALAQIVSEPTIFSSVYKPKAIDWTDFASAAKEVERRDQVIRADRLAEAMGKAVEWVEKELDRRDEYNRTSEGWLHDSEYLYGDVRARIEEAESLGLPEQVAKLRKVLPIQKAASEVRPSLREPWIPDEIIHDFLSDAGFGQGYRIRDRWQIDKAWSRDYDLDKLGVQRVGERTWRELVMDRLNYAVYGPQPPKYDQSGRMTSAGRTLEEARRLNQELEVADKLFHAWIEGTEGRPEELAEAYNRFFRSWRTKTYPTTIEVEGFSAQKFTTIHPWQAYFANKALDTGRAINASGVGLGKTLSMILLGQRLRQDGMARKPLYIVPRKVILKWIREYQQAFPASKVLNLGNLTVKERMRRLQRASLNEWDAIFITYEGAKHVRISREREQGFLNAKIEGLEEELRRVPKGKRGRSERDIQVLIDKMKERLAKLLDFDYTKTLTFEQMGVDALFIDEAHNFKNLAQPSTGLATTLRMGGGDSQRALDLEMKARYILEANGYRNVFLASATVTPNNPIEVYTMISHIAPDVWSRYGIRSLHAFLAKFGVVEEFAGVDAAGNPKTKAVMAKFQNLGDLRDIRERFIYKRNTADVRREFGDYPFNEPQSNTETVFLQPSPAQRRQLGEILQLAQSGRAQLGKDWQLKIIGMAKKVAAHPGLYRPAEEEYRHPNNKLDAVAARVAQEYMALKENPKAHREGVEEDAPALNGHLIFLDAYGGTQIDPLKRNLHERLRDMLVEGGIPREEIAIVNGFVNTEPKEKDQLSKDYNAGKYRVIIGTTGSMGEGMDLQEITTHIHHVDPQWNPSLIEQREGRGVRQGNLGEDVHVIRYVTEGSFDAFFYGQLAKKRRWLNQLEKTTRETVDNEADQGEEAISEAEVMSVLAPGKASRDYYQRGAEHARVEAWAAKVKSDHLEAQDLLERVTKEIGEREGKVRGYLGQRAQSENKEAYATVIKQHEDALIDLRRRRSDLEAQVEKFSVEHATELEHLEQSKAILAEAEALQARVIEGVSYPQALAEQEFRREGIKLPAGFSPERIADEIADLAGKMAGEENRGLLDLTARSIREGNASVLSYLKEETGSLRGDTIRRVWQHLYGKLPAVKQGEPFRPDSSDRSLGAASSEEMKAAARAKRARQAEDYRRLIHEAQDLGILLPGQTIPTLSEVQTRQAVADIQQLEQAGDKKGAKRLRVKLGLQRKPKAATRFSEAAVPVPEAGLKLTPLEEGILGRAGRAIDRAKHEKLGRDEMSAEEFNELLPEERLVHVTRRVFDARDPKHMERILLAEKYGVWQMPAEDLGALLVAVGRRMADAQIESYPERMRIAVAALERGEKPGIASGKRLATGEEAKFVHMLTPTRKALAGKGIIEGVGGLRLAWEGLKREWNAQMAYGEDVIFRDAEGKHIKKGSEAAEVIATLLDNPEGDEAWIGRPTVKLRDGRIVQPTPRQREIAEEMREIWNELADRQDLPTARRKKFYATHFMDRIIALEPATTKDLQKIHGLAKLKLRDYDFEGLAAKLTKGMRRSKALQIIDALGGTRPPHTMKSLGRRIDIILDADDVMGLPTELYQPYLKKREGAPYRLDAVEMWEVYFRYALRKIHLEPTVQALRPLVERLPRPGVGPSVWTLGFMSQREYAERLFQQVLGRPQAADSAVDAVAEAIIAKTRGRVLQIPILRRLFQPQLASRASIALARLQYLRLLGLGVDSAITNLTQGVNTLVDLGMPNAAAGYTKLLSPKAIEMIRNEHLMAEFQGFFGGQRPFYAKGLGALERIALSPFSMAEAVNRGAAFLAGLEQAKRRNLSFEHAVRLGRGKVSDYLREHLPEEEFRNIFYTSPAATLAREATIRTQFGYSAVESAPVMGTPTGRQVFQFMSYPTQQMAFLWDGVVSSVKHRETMRLIRYLALIGMTTYGAKKLGEMFGLNVSNLWSFWGVMPRRLGPNVALAQDLYESMQPGWRGEIAQARLKTDYPPEVLRYLHKVRTKEGFARYLPIRPAEPTKLRGRREPRRRAAR